MQTQKFDQVEVTCTDNDKVAIADVLQRTDKLLKIAFVGSTMSILLKREDIKKPYVGNFKNLEFISTGETI